MNTLLLLILKGGSNKTLPKERMTVKGIFLILSLVSFSGCHKTPDFNGLHETRQMRAHHARARQIAMALEETKQKHPNLPPTMEKLMARCEEVAAPISVLFEEDGHPLWIYTPTQNYILTSKKTYHYKRKAIHVKIDRNFTVHPAHIEW